MKIVIITGEESGDRLGAALMDSLKILYKDNINLYGIGGNELKKHNIQNFFHLKDINVMGIIEVIPKIYQIKKIINETAMKVININPDVVVTIDSPDFNLRIASAIKNKNKNIKIMHYVAPSVWNWRAGRINTVKKNIDHLLTILPFEKKIFDEALVPTTFVGHPVTDIDLSKYSYLDNKDIEKPIFLILPGSRLSEVSRLLSIFIGAIEISSFKDNFDFVLPTTESMKDEVSQILSRNKLSFDIKVIDNEDKKYEYFYLADFAVIASGTVGLELSYFGVTYASAYKFHPISYFIFKMLIKTKLGSLINIILGKMIIPELIQYDCNPISISQTLEKIINDKEYKEAIKKNVNKALAQLSINGHSSLIASEALMKLINK